MGFVCLFLLGVRSPRGWHFSVDGQGTKNTKAIFSEEIPPNRSFNTNKQQSFTNHIQ
jgi:hypothetical protein